jgi:hypothetical protein
MSAQDLNVAERHYYSITTASRLQYSPTCIAVFLSGLNKKNKCYRRRGTILLTGVKFNAARLSYDIKLPVLTGQRSNIDTRVCDRLKRMQDFVIWQGIFLQEKAYLTGLGAAN